MQLPAGSVERVPRIRVTRGESAQSSLNDCKWHNLLSSDCLGPKWPREKSWQARDKKKAEIFYLPDGGALLMLFHTTTICKRKCKNLASYLTHGHSQGFCILSELNRFRRLDGALPKPELNRMENWLRKTSLYKMREAPSKHLTVVVFKRSHRKPIGKKDFSYQDRLTDRLANWFVLG